MLTLAAACGGSGADLDPEVRQQVLDGSTLQLADLPSGWAENASLLPPRFKEGATLFGYCGKELVISPTGSAASAFERTTQGPYVISTVRAFNGNGASKFMDEMRDAAENCHTWTEADTQGVTAEWTLAPLASIEGDDTIGLRVTVTYADGLRQESDVIVTAQGQFVSEVNHGAVANVTFLDPSLTESLASAARERLSASVAQIEGAGGS